MIWGEVRVYIPYSNILAGAGHCGSVRARMERRSGLRFENCLLILYIYLVIFYPSLMEGQKRIVRILNLHINNQEKGSIRVVSIHLIFSPSI